MYFNVNFNVFFKLIKVHLLVSELYIYQNARSNNKNCWICVTVFVSYSVGRKLVTKRYDEDDDDGDTDMEDITSQYKNPEGNLNFHPVTGRTESFI